MIRFERGIMDLRATEGVASRFKAYIEHLKNAVGHADRREPLAAYCAGLLLPGERKSVEPMAARLAPEEVSAKHQSLHHFVAKAPWEEAALLGAVRTFVLPTIEAGGADPRLDHRRHGHSRRRASIQLAWRANTAGNSASRTIARLRSLFRSRAIRPVCRLPFSFIFLKAGPATRSVAERLGFLTKSSLKPSRRSRSISFGRPSPTASPKASSSPMRVMATTRRSGPA